MRRAGLRRIRLHDLRHGYASLLLASGENIKFVQDQLGHSSAQITLDVYAHLMPHATAGAPDRLEQTVFGQNVCNSVRKTGADANPSARP
ncbi:MAG: tyrosine-type recombinase/integrase [Terriglobia bacterium]